MCVHYSAAEFPTIWSSFVLCSLCHLLLFSSAFPLSMFLLNLVFWTLVCLFFLLCPCYFIIEKKILLKIINSSASGLLFLFFIFWADFSMFFSPMNILMSPRICMVERFFHQVWVGFNLARCVLVSSASCCHLFISEVPVLARFYSHLYLAVSVLACYPSVPGLLTHYLAVLGAWPVIG